MDGVLGEASLKEWVHMVKIGVELLLMVLALANYLVLMGEYLEYLKFFFTKVV